MGQSQEERPCVMTYMRGISVHIIGQLFQGLVSVTIPSPQNEYVTRVFSKISTHIVRLKQTVILVWIFWQDHKQVAQDLRVVRGRVFLFLFLPIKNGYRKS